MQTTTPERDLAAESKQWALILHLSQFAGVVVPGLGWIAPIVIWAVKKDELDRLDDHGRVVINWLLSTVIYIVVSIVLALTVVGLIVAIPMWIALSILVLVYPIIGAIKGNDGKVWVYPGSIPFLAVAEG